MEQDSPGTFRLIACRTLLYERRHDRYIRPGRTIGECLRELGWKTDGLSARVFIDGHLVQGAEWEYAMPTAGQAVVVRTVMADGGGGGGGKQIGMIVGMLALMAATWWIGGGGLAGLLPEALQMMGTVGGWQAVGAAVLVGGSLALNALIPPSRPRLEDLSGVGNASSALSLTGSSNKISPYGRIPRVYGTHRIYPPLVARPYTELVGNNQFLRLLYCFGYGPLSLADIKIGETPISQFSSTEMEIRYGYPGEPPLTLVPDDVIEDSQSLRITAAMSWQVRVSEGNAKELSIDVSFPSGLTRFDGSNRATEWAVSLDVEYRKVGDVAWVLAGGAAATAASATTSFSGGNNDMVFTRTTAGSSGNGYTVHFVGGLSLQVKRETIELPSRGGPPQSYTTNNIIIQIVNGVTTAAQVKAAYDAVPDVVALATVANASFNDGTGAITLPATPMNSRTVGNYFVYFQIFQFSGGAAAVPTLTVSGFQQTLIRRSIRWIVYAPGAQYEIRIRRVTPDTHPNGDRLIDETYWTMVRTIQAASPVQKDGLCLLALRIKATDQLNGTVDTLNAIASSVLPDWDGANWVMRITNNPASIYRDVLQGTANRRPKPDSRLDLPAIQSFHDQCRLQQFTFNAVIDFQTTVKQLRQDVLAAGRATVGLRDMKYSVVQDLLQAIPVDILTPRTTSGFQWTRRFLAIPHAFRVRFVDETNDYKQGERIVYADGYTALNAVDFEETDAGLGVTNPTQVWKLKRRELAEALLRADDYEVQMDFANLNCTRGDRVQLQHDVILAGLVTARITSVTLNGSNEATAMTFDEPFVMADGVNFGARIRKATGVQVVQQVVTVAGEVVAVSFTVPIPVASVPAVGDLVTFGELGRESIDCVVKHIEPGSDFTAKIKLLDYAPGIQLADVGLIPPYDSQMTFPRVPIPPIPTIIQVLSDESVFVRSLDGSLQSQIVVSVHFPSGFRLVTSRVEAQVQVAGADNEWQSSFTDMAGTSLDVIIGQVESGIAYDIRLRSVDQGTGRASEWAVISAHMVIGKTSPPPDVQALVLEGERLRWDYTPPADHAGFLVRFRPGNSTDWEAATPAHEHVLRVTDFQIFKRTGTQTYLVKAVDVAGNQSLHATAITVVYEGVIIDNIVLTENHRALGWPGTITDGSIISGDIKADSSAMFWTEDTAPMWSPSSTALMWTAAFSRMTYEFTVEPTSEQLDAMLKLSITMQGLWSIEYQADSSAVMWQIDSTAAMWGGSGDAMWSSVGPYMQWPGQIDHLRRQPYKIRIIGYAGTVQAVLQELSGIFDVRDLLETVNDAAISALGTRLSLTKSYREIVSVRTMLLDDAGSSAYAKVMDKSASLGPLIKVFDKDGVATTGLVDAIVHGY